jgi:hypothetical protein
MVRIPMRRGTEKGKILSADLLNSEIAKEPEVFLRVLVSL